MDRSIPPGDFWEDKGDPPSSFQGSPFSGEKNGFLPPLLTRREIFRLSLPSLLFLKGVGSLRLLYGGGGSPPSPSLHLSSTQFGTLRAVVDTLYPPGRKFPSGIELKVPEKIDRALYFSPPATREQLRLALDLVEYGGVLIGYLGRFSRLPFSRREKGFRSLLEHPFHLFRQVGSALKQVVQFFYFTEPAVWPLIGYEGPFVSPKPPEKWNYYEEEKEKEFP